MTLFEQAATFLETAGWEVARLAKGPSSIVASKEELGESRYVTVWCPTAEEMRHLRQWEPATLRRFAEDAAKPGGKVLLLESRAGLTRNFRDQTTASGVKVQAPIEFFDHRFCWDDSAPEARRAASVAARMRKAGNKAARDRVPQPYHDTDGNHGDDLMDELARRFESSAEWDRPIILVTAPAGFGKTMLFQALFSRLHEHFMAAKGRHERARRPLPLLPEHMNQASSGTLPSLVDQFLHTDVAGTMSRSTFEWMLVNGYGCWLLDGLDEIIARDPLFFEYIEHIILGADKVITPRILLCVRDSLMSTSESLRTLVNEVDGSVTRFQLQPWKIESIKTFARMRLTKEHDWKMMSWVKQPQVLELCGTPYYAELVADRVKDNRVGLALTSLPETELVRDSIRAVLMREYGKDLIREEQFSYDDLYDVVREAATLQMESVPRGIDIEQFADLIALLVSELDPADQEVVSAQILKLSVFTAAPERGRIRFTHDVIQEYLVAEQAQGRFGSHPGRLLDLLNYQQFPSDSIALRILTEYIDSHGASDELRPLLIRAASSGQHTAFRNLLSVAVRLRDAANLLRDAPLDRQDLSGLTFAGLVLDGVRMRDTNLESAVFDNCDLTGLDLSGAVLHDTRFNRCQKTIHDATYGDLSGLVSVVIDGRKRIETTAAFSQLLRRTGKRAGATVDPCAHAVQLRTIFNTFLFPDGRLRRSKVKRKNLVKGSAADASAALLDGAIRAGFIIHVPGREWYEMKKGQPHQGMVKFVRNLEPTQEIVALLNGLCPIKGCTHTGL